MRTLAGAISEVRSSIICFIPVGCNLRPKLSCRVVFLNLRDDRLLIVCNLLIAADIILL